MPSAHTVYKARQRQNDAANNSKRAAQIIDPEPGVEYTIAETPEAVAQAEKQLFKRSSKLSRRRGVVMERR